MTCDAAIRPLSDLTIEFRCNVDGVLPHDNHRAPAGATQLVWHDADRRSYHGPWPGLCGRTPGCVFPAGHPRTCIA